MKFKCIECGAIIAVSEVLHALNPFDNDLNIEGCPNCKDIATLRVVCDEPGCNELATCGTPTPTGYRNTCGKHVPQTGRYGGR